MTLKSRPKIASRVVVSAGYTLTFLAEPILDHLAVACDVSWSIEGSRKCSRRKVSSSSVDSKSEGICSEQVGWIFCFYSPAFGCLSLCLRLRYFLGQVGAVSTTSVRPEEGEQESFHCICPGLPSFPTMCPSLFSLAPSCCVKEGAKRSSRASAERSSKSLRAVVLSRRRQASKDCLLSLYNVCACAIFNPLAGKAG
jgi:hypothetical protein